MSVPVPIKLSLYDAMNKELLKRQRHVLLSRAYFDGNQPVNLTDRQRDYLDIHSDDRFCLNVCRTVVTTLTDELTVIGFDTGEKDNNDGIKEQAMFFWDVWNKNRLDGVQSEAHEWAERDGESFLVMDWDDENKMPIITLHEYYTDINVSAWEYKLDSVTNDMLIEARGTGTGMIIKYQNDDVMQPMEYAAQYWYEEVKDSNGDAVFVHRRTIYYPNRIERFAMGNDGRWELVKVQKWVDKAGQPLGIPVAHLKNKDLRSELWDAIPPQDVVNKTWADILAASDLTGFPIHLLWGAYPTTDGKKPAADNSNVWGFYPGQIFGNAEKLPGEVDFTRFEGSDPTPLMNTLKDQIVFIAQVTGTPVTKFIASAQVASAETQKEQKESLRKRANTRRILFGDAWEDAMKICRRLSNVFGDTNYDETITVETLWDIPEEFDEIVERTKIGVPEETLWGEVGYTQEQIQAMKETPEYRLKFSKAFYEAYNIASQSGVSINDFARLIGIPDEMIPLLGGADTVPPTEM
jgi:hypothetical protein